MFLLNIIRHLTLLKQYVKMTKMTFGGRKVDDDSDGEAESNSSFIMCNVKFKSMVMCEMAYSCAFCCFLGRERAKISD